MGNQMSKELLSQEEKELIKKHRSGSRAIWWGIDDVQHVAKNKGMVISDKRAIKVLGSIIDNHDAEHGINWVTIDCHLDMEKEHIKERLEYLREELIEERISCGELVELQGLADHINKDDTELLEAAGVPGMENKEIYTIVNSKSGHHYDTNDERFYTDIWERTMDNESYLKDLIKNNPEKFEGCEIEKNILN